MMNCLPRSGNISVKATETKSIDRIRWICYTRYVYAHIRKLTFDGGRPSFTPNFMSLVYLVVNQRCDTGWGKNLLRD